MPIRARLTAAFALAMLVVIAVAALFIYLRLRSNLDETINTGLQSRSDDVAALIARSTRLAEPGASRLVESEEGFVQILTPNGRFIDGTTERRAPSISAEEAIRAFESPEVFERPVPGIEGTARILARPVMTQGGAVVVVTGASLQDRKEQLGALLASFVIGGPVAVLLASGVGYLLAAAGFAPVEAMRRRAARISFTHGGERLPLPAAHDEIRRLGETLNEMLARMEASFERERRFVADASHELRTPLAVMKAELEAALRSGGDEAAIRESLVAALEETDQMTQLAEDLLLIARAADGRLPVRREEVDVRDLLERTQQRFADRAREQGREIQVQADGALRASVDPLRGRQALGNLVDNSLRHGSGAIRLAARQDNGTVQIDVSDEGPGFSDELVPRAFERFARGSAERARGGAGLGLAIVRAIAEAHGGTATIAQNPSGGATVRLHIPAGGAGAE